MSQILRIQGQVFHMPSVARVALFSSPFLGFPRIQVINHDGRDYLLKYKINDWEKAQTHFKKLEASRALCYETLKKIPLMEEPSPPNPLVECERSEMR